MPQPLFQTTACPPHNAGIDSAAMYTIGRTMFETDRLTPEHAARCNAMDEVWVPTAFHKVRLPQMSSHMSALVAVLRIAPVCRPHVACCYILCWHPSTPAS